MEDFLAQAEFLHCLVQLLIMKGCEGKSCRASTWNTSAKGILAKGSTLAWV